MTTRIRWTATYSYPGALFPEEVTRDLPEPTWTAVLAAGPVATREESYFTTDGWYAATIREISETLYRSSETSEEQWIASGNHILDRFVVGIEFHVDDIPDDRLIMGGPAVVDGNVILKANIRSNSREPMKDIGVLCRSGNWQIASDYDVVVRPEGALHG